MIKEEKLFKASQHLHEKLAEYAAVTPGAGDKFTSSLKAVKDKIEVALEPSAQDAQEATQAEEEKIFNVSKTSGRWTKSADIMSADPIHSKDVSKIFLALTDNF